MNKLSYLYINAFLIWVFLNLAFLHGQINTSHLWLVKFEDTKKLKTEILDIKYLSDWNSKGYNNQPYFLDNHQFLATLRLEDQTNFNIFLFDLNDQTYRKVIPDNGSHFSPRIFPELNHQITTVHLPMDNEGQQILAVYDLISGKLTKTLTNPSDRIGYYRWINTNQWVCFLVDSIPSLAIVSLDPYNKKIFASGIGRSFEVDKHQNILFVQQLADSSQMLKEYNLINQKIRQLAVMPNGTEDFSIDPDGEIYCANGSQIFILNKSNATWMLWLDLGSFSINKISRLFVTHGNILLVNEP